MMAYLLIINLFLCNVETIDGVYILYNDIRENEINYLQQEIIIVNSKSKLIYFLSRNGVYQEEINFNFTEGNILLINSSIWMESIDDRIKLYFSINPDNKKVFEYKKINLLPTKYYNQIQNTEHTLINFNGYVFYKNLDDATIWYVEEISEDYYKVLNLFDNRRIILTK